MSGVDARDSSLRRGRRLHVHGILALVIAIALLLRTHHLSDTSLSFDESCSAKISTFEWGEMVQAISRDAHPPGYYVVLKVWRWFAGDGPLMGRWLSVLFGVATIPAAFHLIQIILREANLRGERIPQASADAAALLAAAFVATSPLHVGLSQEARPYALGAFLTVLALGFLLQAVGPEGKAANWCLFTVAAALLSMTHYYALFTIAGAYVFAWTAVLATWWRTGWNSRTKRRLGAVALSTWSMQLVWIAWLPIFQIQRERANAQLWMDSLDWAQLSAIAWETLTGERGSLGIMVNSVALAIWGMTVLALLVSQRRGDRLIALCAGVPWLGCIAYGLAVRSILGSRYLVLAHGCLLIGWGLIASQFRTRAARVVVSAIMLSWCGIGCWRFLETRAAQTAFPGTRGAVAYLDDLRRAEEPVIVASPFVHPIVQQYSATNERIFVRYNGNPHFDLLAGPPLRETECLSTKDLLSLRWERVCVVDVSGPNVGDWIVRLPREYRLASEQRFPEWHPRYRLEIVIREYVRVE